ncbi:MAG: TolC family protein [Legionellales bacterium]
MLAAFALMYLKPQAQISTGYISLGQLISNMQSNYELLKTQGSLVLAKQAQKKAVDYERLPRLNTMLQATVSSHNNLEGTYMTYGVIPSVTSGTRPESNLSAVSGDAAFAGLNWEAVNFGAYKAREDLAKSDLVVQTSNLLKTQYDLQGIASAYYMELLRQFELQTIQQDNVNRLQQLKTSITALVSSGTRPGVDSMVASAELSKSLVSLYEARKNFSQTQVQLSTLTGLVTNQLTPDTNAENKIMQDGAAFVFNSPVDTAHHPYINLYSSIYDLSKARLKLEKNSYYPKVFVDADAWMRGSSVDNKDHFNSDLLVGYEPSRFNYLVGLTLTYDIFNIAHKRLNSSIYKFQSDAANHQLLEQKDKLSGAVQQALLEKDFQLNRLIETKHQLDAASSAYTQQLSLYQNGLSSIIDLNTALSYYLQAQRDYLDAKVGLMSSILNYSLVTNSFNSLVQTLKL